MAENTNTNLEHIEYGDTVEQVFAKTNDAFDKINENEQGVKNLDEAVLAARTNGVTGATHETLKARLDADSQLIKELDEKHDNDVNSLERTVESNKQEINNRVNNLIIQNNPTEGNSELIDIRLGADGKAYKTAGEAVRSQVKLAMRVYPFVFDKSNYQSMNDLPFNAVFTMAFSSADNVLDNYPMGAHSDTALVITKNKNSQKVTSGDIQIVIKANNFWMRTYVKRDGEQLEYWSNWLDLLGGYASKTDMTNSLKYRLNSIGWITNKSKYQSMNDLPFNSVFTLAFSSADNVLDDYPTGAHSRTYTGFNINASTSKYSIGDKQIIIGNSSIFQRTYENGKFGQWVTNNFASQEVVNSEISKNTPITVKKSGGANFTSLLEAILSVTTKNKEVIVYDGIYDLEEEFKAYYGEDFFNTYTTSSVVGIILKDGIHLRFSNNAKVVFNYTGNNTVVNSRFSPLNSGLGGFILDNVTIEAKNCRYCVHDERGANTDRYENIYRGCTMVLDNSENPGWGSKQCIGGGLGEDGYIIIENCRFESKGISSAQAGIVSYHNSSSANAKSNVTIKDCYFEGLGTIRCSWYGQSQKETIFLLSNNNIGSQIVIRKETSDGSSPYENIKVIEWNNHLRTA